MITIFTAAIVSAATTFAIYWLLHRANPDLAQQTTDAIVNQAKEDVKDVVDTVKGKFD